MLVRGVIVKLSLQKLLPRKQFKHLLPSEQNDAWEERNVQTRARARMVAEQNVAMKDAETEKYLQTHFCPKPFDTMETTPEGLVYVCCPAWLPTPIGTVRKSLFDSWRGKTAKKLRASIVDKSYKYCSRLHCEDITGRRLIARDSEQAQSLIKSFVPSSKIIPPPRQLILSHDRSCNLSCPSCRKELIVASKPKQDKLDEFVEETVLPMLKEVDLVYITGSGDPFGSNHFRRLLKRLTRAEFPNLSIHLHTNAQLWDQRAWQELELAGRICTAHISIDAAERETYAVLRRGGSFDRLLENLAFIKDLRQSGEIKSLMISMVVQKMNYRQMPDFVRLGKHYAADLISFQMIRDWYSYSEEEFKNVYVGRDHPDFPDLIEVLKSPELSWPGVDIGNIITHVRINAAGLKTAARR